MAHEEKRTPDKSLVPKVTHLHTALTAPLLLYQDHRQSQASADLRFVTDDSARRPT